MVRSVLIRNKKGDYTVVSLHSSEMSAEEVMSNRGQRPFEGYCTFGQYYGNTDFDLREISKGEEGTHGKLEIVCPHCGYVYEDSSEYAEDCTVKCPSCKSCFDLEIKTGVVYT